MPSTQPLCERLLSEAAEAATSCAWQRQLKSKAKSSPWWLPCGTGPSKSQQPQAGHPLLALPLLIGNPSSVSPPSPHLVTRIQRPAASYIQTFVAPKGKAVHSIEELMAFQRVPSCHTTVHKPKQHTTEQPVHIQLLTNRVRKRRKMSCEIHICWKRDSYHIVSFSVKTAATLLLECVCLHRTTQARWRGPSYTREILLFGGYTPFRRRVLKLPTKILFCETSCSSRRWSYLHKGLA